MKRAQTALLLSLLLIPSGSWIGATGRVIAGGVVGLAAGTGVAIGVVVARATFQNAYIESYRDVYSWQGAPVPAGLIAGGVAGAAGGTVLAGVSAGMVVGAAVGAALGTGAGALLSSEDPDRWAGGTMGGAVGIFLGFLAGWILARRRSRPRRGAGLAAAALVPLVLVGCGSEDPVEPVRGEPVPAEAGAAEDVVVLVGDPGKARYRYYPVLPRVAQDVAAWAEAIGRDSAVTVLVLGDMVYPDGMHEPGTPGYPTDSARVADQIDMVREPAALEHDARLYFVAGNHDWGLAEDQEGARRLRNLGAFVDRERERGANVDLAPSAGSGVPDVEDIGDRLRLILLDTAWWLFDAEPGGKDAFVDGVREAMRTAGDREVVIAAHHPYESAGPHGGVFPVWQTLGLRRLLYKSGALLQDLDSRPYTAMRRELGEVFREHGRPLAFVGGHEHSLQVIAHDAPTAPHYSIVSGSASKLTGVGMIPGTMFQLSAPGYIQLVVREDGAVDVEVMAAPDRYLSCPQNELGQLKWERCMAEGQAAFESVYSARLTGSGPTAGAGPGAGDG